MSDNKQTTEVEEEMSRRLQDASGEERKIDGEDRKDREIAHAICAMIAQVRIDLAEGEAIHALQEEWTDLIKREKEDPLGVAKQRLEAIKIFQKIREETQEENERRINEEAPEHMKAVLRAGETTRNVVAIERLIEISGASDTTLPQDMLNGFQTIGESQRTGYWKLDEKAVAAQDVKEYYSAAVAVREAAPKGFPMEHLQDVITNIEEDVKLGRFKEISEADLKVTPSFAFPKREPTKTRVIIDERFKNLFSSLPEKVNLAGTRVIAELISAYNAPRGQEQVGVKARIPTSQSRKETAAQVKRALDKSVGEEKSGLTSSQRKKERKQAWKRAKAEARVAWEKFTEEWAENGKARGEEKMPGIRPDMGSKDFKKAYFQVGVAHPEENAIGAFDPKKGIYRYYLSYVLNMGNRHSVTSWCRCAELVMRVTARVGAVVSPIYIDDATVLAAPGTLDLALEVYETCAAAMGLELSDKEESNQRSDRGGSVKTLGIVYTWEEDQDGKMIRATVPEEQYGKLEKLITELESQLERKELQQKQLEQVLGLANFITCASEIRTGSELLRGIYSWTGDGFASLVVQRHERRALGRSLGAIRRIASQRRPTIFREAKTLRRRLALWTDASSDGGTGGKARIAAFLVDERGQAHVAAQDVEGEDRIEALEAMAVNMAQETFAEELQNAEVLASIDNITTVYAFIKASSKSGLTQKYAVKTIEAWYAVGVKALYLYCPSEENIADWYTRIEKQAKAQSITKATWRRAQRWDGKEDCVGGVVGNCGPDVGHQVSERNAKRRRRGEQHPQTSENANHPRGRCVGWE